MSQAISEPTIGDVQFINTDLPDIIELRNVNQQYKDEKTGKEITVLENLNLLIEDKPNVGQFVVLCGASGCGKSTLLRFISGLQKPTTGDVLLHGKPLTDRDHIGMVFQSYSCFPWLTVYDNVELGLKWLHVPKGERKDKVEEMLNVVDLMKHKDKYPKMLSGGQQQRVAIARSLVVNNNILLLDEPFGALDINTRRRMQDMLLQIWSAVHPTFILVTHDTDEAVYLADDIYLMRSNPGKIVHHINVPLPYPRENSIKRTSQFLQIKYELEDKMQMVSAMSQLPLPPKQ